MSIIAILFWLVAGCVSPAGRAQTILAENVAVDVSAVDTWTQTPLYVAQSDTLFLYALGAIGAGADSVDWRDWSGPDGAYPTEGGGCSACPLPGYPLRALIARIGGGEPFLVGSFAAVVSDFSGALYLGINDNSPAGNEGTIRAFVWRLGEAATSVDDGKVPPLASFKLYQNVPNPFNPTTTIRFCLPQRMQVTLDIYDVGGRLVIRLLDQVRPAGENSIVWMGEDKRGSPAASGVYFYRLCSGDLAATRKMILLR